MFITSLVLLMCVAVAVASLWILGEKAARLEPNPTQKEAASPPEETEGVDFITVDWDYWLQINPDIVGWVYVEGTTVNYPIVLAPSEDPEYYLSHDIYRDPNPFGCPYLDAECSKGLLESPNAIVYGHHITGGQMFAPFASYSDYGFAEDHRFVQVLTPESNHLYSVMAAQVVSADRELKRTSFADTFDYERYVVDFKRNATVLLSGASFKQDILFVTCSYNLWENERTLVMTTEELAS